MEYHVDASHYTSTIHLLFGFGDREYTGRAFSARFTNSIFIR